MHEQGYAFAYATRAHTFVATTRLTSQALDLCQELFLADGALADEEDVVLQDLGKLLE
jgi:hypothetical protein